MRYILANGQHLRIRKASPDDAAGLLEMFRQVVTETDFLMTTPSEAGNLTLGQEKDFIKSYLHNDHQLLLVADVEGTVAGTLSVTQAKTKKQSHVGEFGIVVLQKYWNMGIARRMMNTMDQWLEKQEVIRYVHLSVMAGNEKAVRLYHKFGFMEVGRQPRAVRQHDHSFQDVIMMGRWYSEDRR